MKVILASASPRRRELLGKLFEAFEVCPAQGGEHSGAVRPEEIVMELAQAKAEEVEKRFIKAKEDSCLIIGADTVVAWNGEILGKPEDEADAKRMLRMLSGKTHQVYTGVTWIYSTAEGKKEQRFYECTDVTFAHLSEEEIDFYIQTKEPLDKAGGYGIQGIGGRYVSRIAGDYYNVVGLPVAHLYQELYSCGIFSRKCP